MSTTIKVGAILRNEYGQILLIKERYVKEDGFKWNLIKGTLDSTSETHEECVKREIYEEVGLSNLGVISLKNSYHYGTAEKPKTLFVFNVQYLGGQTPNTHNNNQEESISEIKWFSEEEINKLTRQDCVASYVYDSIKDGLK